ncbi:hypothetical protein HO133_006228 [Letharia lupina]|uniref:Uncharacterized protein n=1 Tax=Letharia lupina TaxID=560253 RepID=A0A8H6C7T1_9LECA|nr:uncharacterized protein HO133_006228 [Letharia lupina]KAF6218266.1 hypothetical protein HO133_006228 [Letharia lupina]
MVADFAFVVSISAPGALLLPAMSYVDLSFIWNVLEWTPAGPKLRSSISMGVYSNDDGKRPSNGLSLQETSRLEMDFAAV